MQFFDLEQLFSQSASIRGINNPFPLTKYNPQCTLQGIQANNCTARNSHPEIVFSVPLAAAWLCETPIRVPTLNLLLRQSLYSRVTFLRPLPILPSEYGRICNRLRRPFNGWFRDILPPAPLFQRNMQRPEPDTPRTEEHPPYIPLIRLTSIRDAKKAIDAVRREQLHADYLCKHHIHLYWVNDPEQDPACPLFRVDAPAYGVAFELTLHAKHSEIERIWIDRAHPHASLYSRSVPANAANNPVAAPDPTFDYATLPDIITHADLKRLYRNEPQVGACEPQPPEYYDTIRLTPDDLLTHIPDWQTAPHLLPPKSRLRYSPFSAGTDSQFHAIKAAAQEAWENKVRPHDRPTDVPASQFTFVPNRAFPYALVTSRYSLTNLETYINPPPNQPKTQFLPRKAPYLYQRAVFSQLKNKHALHAMEDPKNRLKDEAFDPKRCPLDYDSVGGHDHFKNNYLSDTIRNETPFTPEAKARIEDMAYHFNIPAEWLENSIRGLYFTSQKEILQNLLAIS